MTNKRRLTIKNDHGEHIMAVYVEPKANGFEGADLSGLCAIMVKNLRGTNFKRAELYWANLQGSDLSDCNFEEANLQGASLQDTLFINANLRNAKLGRDNLGGSTHLQGADLSGAILDGADLSGAIYDDKTKFPVGFNPELAGMVHANAS